MSMSYKAIAPLLIMLLFSACTLEDFDFGNGGFPSGAGEGGTVEGFGTAGSGGTQEGFSSEAGSGGTERGLSEATGTYGSGITAACTSIVTCIYEKEQEKAAEVEHGAFPFEEMLAACECFGVFPEAQQVMKRVADDLTPLSWCDDDFLEMDGANWSAIRNKYYVSTDCRTYGDGDMWCDWTSDSPEADALEACVAEVWYRATGTVTVRFE